MTDAVDDYINAHSKSQGFGFLLTLVLGPLGLFYSNWIAALILCVIAVASIATPIPIIIQVICWILSIAISFYTVSDHNEKVQATANLIHKTQS